MRPEETRIAIAAQRAREYEAFSRFARAEKLAELRASIRRPLGSAVLMHSSLDDATEIAQNFVFPGIGIRPETVRSAEYDTSPTGFERPAGAVALRAVMADPEVPRLAALRYSTELREQQAA